MAARQCENFTNITVYEAQMLRLDEEFGRNLRQRGLRSVRRTGLAVPESPDVHGHENNTLRSNLPHPGGESDLATVNLVRWRNLSFDFALACHPDPLRFGCAAGVIEALFVDIQDHPLLKSCIGFITRHASYTNVPKYIRRLS